MHSIDKFLLNLLAISALLVHRAKAQDFGYGSSNNYNSNSYDEKPAAVSEYSTSNSDSYTPVVEVIPPPARKPYETGEEGPSYSSYSSKSPGEEYNSSPYENSGASSLDSYSTDSSSVSGSSLGSAYRPNYQASGTDYQPSAVSYQSTGSTYQSTGSAYPSSGSSYQPSEASYQPSGSAYRSDEEYGVNTYEEQGSYTEDDFSFITSFDQIISQVAAYQESLTKPMQQLVSDTTGRTGLAICKLSSTRIRLTRATKKLLESFGHWAKLGTSLEEAHCRQDARQSLDAFLVDVEKVSVELASIQDDIDEQPLTAFKQLENLLSKIKYAFESGRGILLSEYSDPHHSH